MAGEYYERPYELVETQIQLMSNRANEALAQANSAFSAIAALALPFENVTAPRLTMPPDTPVGAPTTPEPERPEYPNIDPKDIPDPDDGSSLVNAFLESPDSVPTFTQPPGTTVTIPPTPDPLDTSGKPDAPVLEDPTSPTPPPKTLPELGTLLDVVIPSFAGLNLPAFTAIAPEFTEQKPSTVLAWSEPHYVSTSLDQLRARVATMLAGGTGLTPEIEQALFDRARSRVDIEGARAEQEAFDTWAGRGFEMPPGMLAEQINAVQENNQLQANAASRDILVQAATWEIENLRFAVQNGISLEAQLIALFTNEAERGFQAAKYRVEADISLYQASTALFTALNSAYATKATVYHEVIAGELAKLEVFKAEIDAQRLIGTVNEQTVRVFEGRLRGVATLIEIFKGELEGTRTQLEMQKVRSETYGTNVRAWSEKLAGDKTRFDVFKTQLEGEGLKGQIVDAAARAFAATIQGIEARATIKTQNARTRVEGLNASTQRFIGLITAERDRVAGLSEVSRNLTQVFSADIQKYTTLRDNEVRIKQIDLTKAEGVLRNNLAYFEINMKEYDSALARMIEIMKVRAEGLKAIAQATAQLAAGAMAATHVSAQMDGSARVSDSISTSTDTNYNYNMTP